jgi:hypothetical protein
MPMDESEQEYLLELGKANICPNCGKAIPGGTRIGTGKKSDGIFCSLDCLAQYHETELIERAKKVSALAQRHRTS